MRSFGSKKRRFRDLFKNSSNFWEARETLKKSKEVNKITETERRKKVEYVKLSRKEQNIFKKFEELLRFLRRFKEIVVNFQAVWWLAIREKELAKISGIFKKYGGRSDNVQKDVKRISKLPRIIKETSKRTNNFYESRGNAEISEKVRSNLRTFSGHLKTSRRSKWADESFSNFQNLRSNSLDWKQSMTMNFQKLY